MATKKFNNLREVYAALSDGETIICISDGSLLKCDVTNKILSSNDNHTWFETKWAFRDYLDYELYIPDPSYIMYRYWFLNRDNQFNTIISTKLWEELVKEDSDYRESTFLDFEIMKEIPKNTIAKLKDNL